MNYRHIYHAGNFADIFKHLIFLMAVGYLQNKDKGIFILDAFAGCGLYNLDSQQATRTREYASGVEAFMQSEFSNTDLSDFQTLLRPYWKGRTYPGSPVLAAAKLRAQDRLVANELHPEDLLSLKDSLKGFPNKKILHLDAYESIRASIPPAERRGVILIDPPFERIDEFEMLAGQMKEWVKRWSTGCYMIWYPIKAGSNAHLMFDAAQELGIKNAWVGEFLLHPRHKPGSFNGCGVLILNTPYSIPQRVEELAPLLCTALNGLDITSQWLSQD